MAQFLDPMDYFLLNDKTGELRTAKPLDKEALEDATGLLVVIVRVSIKSLNLFRYVSLNFSKYLPKKMAGNSGNIFKNLVKFKEIYFLFTDSILRSIYHLLQARELVNGVPVNDESTISTTQASITIRDVNDSPPTFNQNNYFVSLSENTAVGTPLPVEITVTDPDVVGVVDITSNFY